MAGINTPSTDTADLLQKLSLDSQAKSHEVHDTSKKFGSYASRNTINSLAKPYERSTTPIQDYNGLNMYYPPGAYSYYFGGYDELSLWNDYRYLGHDGVNMHSGLQQRHLNNGVNQAGTGGYTGRSHLNDHLYGHFGNTYRGGSGFGLNYYNPKYNYSSVDNKYPSKGRSGGFFGSGNENKDILNELSKGPRVRSMKNQPGFESIKLAVKGQDLSLKDDNEEKSTSITEKEHLYNKDDFPESFKDARFFIIKSYSEDDIHKSIKYNVWASTPNGNKKLDAAYQEAKSKPEACRVFLLFSVNASGQFVGMAEMVGSVDFDKSMDFWQQDKWTGCFPVEWHIVKDIPNNLLKHITLENNDDKPVTNSRDTQEVKLEQGVQVLKIFKSYSNRTSVLDDFDFYEGRQKALQEKKARRQQYQKQSKKDNSCGDEKLMKSLEADAAAAVKLMKSLDADAAAAAFIEGSTTASLPNGHANTLPESPNVTEVAKAAKSSGATDEVASAC